MPRGKRRQQKGDQHELRTDLILRTYAEVAQYFHTNERAVRTWANTAGFPGRKGRPGKQSDGHFPADAIRDWLVEAGIHVESVNGKHKHEEATHKTAILATRAAMAELAYREKLGRTVDAGVVADFIARTVTQTVALLDEMPDRVLAEMPVDLSDELRARIRRVVRSVVSDCRSSIAELADKDQDDSD